MSLRKWLGWRGPSGSYGSLPGHELAVQNVDPLPDPEASAPIFVSYTGLKIDSRVHMIRILALLPGREDESIRCTLETAYMSKDPEYQALSYCWGDVTDLRIIYCNDLPVTVTVNLRDALRQLRLRYSPRRLWVDALCINQQDIDERNEQVPLMREIYSKCSQVVVWLGESDTHSREGFWLVHHLATAGLLDPKTLTQRPEDIRSISNLSKKGIPLFSDSRWASFCKILLRPYFRRTWIVQEIVLAPKVVVICGEDSADWYHFGLVPKLMVHLKVPALFASKDHEPIMPIQHVKELRKSGNLIPLFSYIGTFSGHFATDPRDKIYGFLGIASECGPDDLNIKVDYGMPYVEVYRRFAVAMLSVFEDRLILLSVPRPCPLHQPDGLPSWVPDWRGTEANRSSPLPRLILSQRFRASGDTEYTPKSRTDGSLELEGYSLQEIEDVGPLLTTTKLVLEPCSAAAFKRLFMGAELYLGSASLVRNHSGPVYRDGSDILHTYAQILQAGWDPSEMVRRKKLFHNMMLGHKVTRAVSLICILTPNRYFYMLVYFLITFFMRIMGWLDVQATLDWDYTVSESRRVAVTKDGWMGLAPGIAMCGDSIVLVKGGPVPLLLRRKGTAWEFIGEIYVHGIMFGEEFNADRCEPISVI